MTPPAPAALRRNRVYSAITIGVEIRGGEDSLGSSYRLYRSGASRNSILLYEPQLSCRFDRGSDHHGGDQLRARRARKNIVAKVPEQPHQGLNTKDNVVVDWHDPALVEIKNPAQ